MNKLIHNGDGTISDEATGLMWMEEDSGTLAAGARGDGTMNWEEALAWSESLEHAGYSDWRLPNAKELQSIVDYSRCPDATGSAAIDPQFKCSSYIDGNGLTNFHAYWTSTTHLDGVPEGAGAVYVSFGESLGWTRVPPETGAYELVDAHGAGAQRSDPKSGTPVLDAPGFGPQGDIRWIYNMVRCVRDGAE
jgi:hypothetical protein